MVDSVGIDSELASIPGIMLQSQAGTATAPSAGYYLLRIHNGVLEVAGSSGTWQPFSNPLSAAGSLIVGGTAGALGELPVGSDSDVLTVDPATHVPAWAPPAAPSGGGTQAYVGAQTAGASWVAMVQSRVYAKQIVLADPAVVLSVDAYLKGDNSHVAGFLGGLAADTAGSPGAMLSASLPSINSSWGIIIGTEGRWFSFPVGAYVAAGTYWALLLCTLNGSSGHSLAYDGSGSDKYNDPGGTYWWNGATWQATTNDYSLRANTLSVAT